MKQMLTTAEVAKLWGCSQKWVQAVIRRGSLRATLFGKTHLVNRMDADQYRHRSPGRPSQNGHSKAAPQKQAKRLKRAPNAKAG